MAGFAPPARNEKMRTVSGPAVAPMLTQTDESVTSPSNDAEVGNPLVKADGQLA